MNNQPPSTRVAFDTLGCKLNQAESELLAKQFTEAGYILVSSIDKADVYILNTCTVTHIADRKARHLLRLAHRRNPSAVLVATGCYTQRASRELAQIEGVSFVINNDEKPQLLRLLEESGHLSNPAQSSTASLHTRTRSFVKIQDGCNSFCAYCIVPFVRGREKSLPTARIISEIKQRVSEGYKEVVLTGTEIGAYNCDSVNLKELLEQILAQTDVTRLRLSSLQPQEITPELIGLWRDDRLCRHFHLSLQSGSDSVLNRMKRCYSACDYQRAVAIIRALLPEAAITTDIIVGFPGETDSEFEESYNFCRQTGFARIHVFSYSLRRETQAARMPHQIGDKVKRERSKRMLALAKEAVRNFSQQFLGKTMTVLWEKQTGGIWSGLTDNYIKVYTRSNEDLTNKLLPVKLTEVRGDGVWGKV